MQTQPVPMKWPEVALTKKFSIFSDKKKNNKNNIVEISLSS